MHDEIKRFNLTGEMSDSKLMQTRERLIKEVEDSMRDEGYVPVLDLLPHFTREYDAESETYRFELSVYGTWVGEQAWEALGIMTGLIVERSTAQAK